MYLKVKYLTPRFYFMLKLFLNKIKTSLTMIEDLRGMHYALVIMGLHKIIQPRLS